MARWCWISKAGSEPEHTHSCYFVVLNPPPSLLATLSFCNGIFLLIVVLVLLPVPMLSLFLTALIESLFFCLANCSLAYFLLMYLYSLVDSSSLSCLLANTEVRSLSTMPTISYSPCIVSCLTTHKHWAHLFLDRVPIVTDKWPETWVSGTGIASGW